MGPWTALRKPPARGVFSISWIRFLTGCANSRKTQFPPGTKMTYPLTLCPPKSELTVILTLPIEEVRSVIMLPILFATYKKLEKVLVTCPLALCQP